MVSMLQGRCQCCSEEAELNGWSYSSREVLTSASTWCPVSHPAASQSGRSPGLVMLQPVLLAALPRGSGWPGQLRGAGAGALQGGHHWGCATAALWVGPALSCCPEGRARCGAAATAHHGEDDVSNGNIPALRHAGVHRTWPITGVTADRGICQDRVTTKCSAHGSPGSVG